MNTKEYEHKIEVIHAMNILMHSLNDEDAIAPWLMNGVPDDCQTIQDIKDTYDNDEFFEDDFNDMTSLFCAIVKNQAKSNTKMIFI